MSKVKQKASKKRKPYKTNLNIILGWLGLGFPKSKLGKGLLVGFLTFMVITIGSMYAVAQWYIAKHANEPVVFGATFVPDYVRFFNLDPEETFDAIVDDLGLERLRLVSYWNIGEPNPGQYNFDELDWQFKKAEESNIDVSLAIGLRQPRWPECHMPEWARGLPKEDWSEKLKVYMGKVIDRYKDSPALGSYQLENEYFLTVFGDCPDHSKERLLDEFEFVKSKDASKPLIVSRSDNAVPSWPIGEPRSDINAASIYKRVWDKTVTNRYFEYPFPAWFYAFLAGGAELTTDRNTFAHELQTEAWLPENTDSSGNIINNFQMNEVESIPEQNKSLDAKRLKDRFDYGVGTGMKTLDVWGVEWWYWQKEVANDPSLWDAAKEQLLKYK